MPWSPPANLCELLADCCFHWSKLKGLIFIFTSLTLVEGTMWAFLISSASWMLAYVTAEFFCYLRSWDRNSWRWYSWNGMLMHMSMLFCLYLDPLFGVDGGCESGGSLLLPGSLWPMRHVQDYTLTCCVSLGSTMNHLTWIGWFLVSVDFVSPSTWRFSVAMSVRTIFSTGCGVILYAMMQVMFFVGLTLSSLMVSTSNASFAGYVCTALNVLPMWYVGYLYVLPIFWASDLRTYSSMHSVQM